MKAVVKHAILLADKEWCDATSQGRIKVYDFKEPKRRSIHALGPGSVCVVLTKARAGQRSIVYGEFTVTEVKEVDANEYNRLAGEGLIYNPQALKPGEKRWIIVFDEFREYRRKVLKKELTDVKTYTSRKPISEWAITGLSYIDEQALEGIRRKTGGFVQREIRQPTASLDERIRRLEGRVGSLEELLGVSELVFPLSHECVEFMLLSIGRQLGFNVYTADPSRTCGNTRLGDLANLSKDALGNIVGPKILEPLSRTDIVWHRSGVGIYVFEVVIGGSMRDALLRLSGVGELSDKLFIVSDASRRDEFENDLRNPAFSSIRHKCKFITVSSLVKMYVLTSLWSRSIEELRLPYMSR